MVGEVTEVAADGWGIVRSGGQSHPFHVTAIGDGSRSVPVGARVVFRLVPGRLGRWEASEVETV